MTSNLLRKIFLVIALFCATLAPAQTQEQKSESKTIEFLAKAGSLLQKDFYDVGEAGGIKCQILIITDKVNGIKRGCLRVEHYDYRSENTYIGTLDSDEIDACIKSLDYLINEAFATTPEVYTELEYRTRDGVQFGAYYDHEKKGWHPYAKTKSYTDRSQVFPNIENFTKLVDVIKSAKPLLAEKLK